MRDKVVIVTGGFGALGRTVARRAADAGAKVAVIDFAANPPAGLAAELGADALLLGGVDLTNAEHANNAVAAVKKRFGRIDAVVNIAGGFIWETIEGHNAANWDRLYAINLKTALHTTLAALPHLVESHGRIVNIGANAALKADTGMGAYAASKSAVHKLTEALAQEFKGRIAVNAVLPSIIDTDANRRDMKDADFSKWVTPDDLASVILFLASDAANAVTGALVPVTGGV
jgi:NAD(P)-dependent dehydrogenase (short-subunit alcohol dehydrogenase family)